MIGSTLSDTAAPPPPARLLSVTARIVAAHASHNPVAAEQLPELIRSVHQALGGLGQGGATPAAPARPEPAVPVRRSVRHDRITCLECGAEMKMLRRHLTNEHHLSPEAYRERWGLRPDYPMVAPDYAAVRSGLARQLGLGRKRESPAEAAPWPEAQEVPDVSTAAPDLAEAETPVAAMDTEPAAPPAKRRGRKREAQPDTAEAVAPAGEPKAPAPAKGRGRRRANDTGAG